MGSARASFFKAAVLSALVVTAMASCADIAKPRINLILKPANIFDQKGDNPVFRLTNIDRANYRDYMVEMATPDGRGIYIVLGEAMSAAYRSALVAHYLSPLEPDKGDGVNVDVHYMQIEFTSTAEEVSPGMATVSITLKHALWVNDRERAERFVVPFEVSLKDQLVPFRNERDYMLKTSDLMADLLYMAQQEIFDSLQQRRKPKENPSDK